MKKTYSEQICQRCGLGTLRAEPRAVSGGLLHRMWQLNTTNGTFAVKQLNPAIMSRGAHIPEAFRVSEGVARAMAEQGIPAQAAMQCEGEVLHEIAGDYFLIYDWVAGSSISAREVQMEQALIIGRVLARMHALQLHIAGMPPLEWKHFHDEDWDILTYQAVDLELPWAYPVRAALPKILEWTRAYEAAGHILMQNLVVSHRDMDPKNVLWQDMRSPVIIDWEAAGFINPTMEVVNEALNWSGGSTGLPREALFKAVLTGYREAGGKLLSSGREALHGCMGTWLGWLLFNMRRSLGEGVRSEEERQLGVQESKNTLALLKTLAEHEEELVRWVEHA